MHSVWLETWSPCRPKLDKVTFYALGGGDFEMSEAHRRYNYCKVVDSICFHERLRHVAKYDPWHGDDPHAVDTRQEWSSRTIIVSIWNCE